MTVSIPTFMTKPHREAEGSLGEGTKINLKVAGCLIGLAVSLTAGFVGFAVSTQNKLNEMLRNQSTMLVSQVKNSDELATHTKEIAEQKATLSKYDEFGTPALRALATRVDAIDRRFNSK